MTKTVSGSSLTKENRPVTTGIENQADFVGLHAKSGHDTFMDEGPIDGVSEAYVEDNTTVAERSTGSTPSKRSTVLDGLCAGSIWGSM